MGRGKHVRSKQSSYFYYILRDPSIEGELGRELPDIYHGKLSIREALKEIYGQSAIPHTGPYSYGHHTINIYESSEDESVTNPLSRD